MIFNVKFCTCLSPVVETINNQSMTVYSVGDGTVLIHNLAKAASEPARDLNTLITKANGSLVPTRIRSELSWSSDYSLIYVGNEDGFVIFYFLVLGLL